MIDRTDKFFIAGYCLLIVAIVIGGIDRTDLKKKLAEKEKEHTECVAMLKQSTDTTDKVLAGLKKANASLNNCVDTLKPQVLKLKEQLHSNDIVLQSPSDSVTVNGGEKKILDIQADGNIYWYRPGKKTVHIQNGKELNKALMDALNGLCPGREM